MNDQKTGRAVARLLTVVLAVVLGTAGVGRVPLTVYSQDGQVPEPQAALGSGFTYQGKLMRSGEGDSSGSVSGPCDFTFSLWDEPNGGNQLGGLDVPNVWLDDGLFTVRLDFGPAAFTGGARWLEIEVFCEYDETRVKLEPRQELTPSPYAIHALHAAALYAADGEPANVVYVDKNGLVGIGTTSPTAGLEINKGTTNDVALKLVSSGPGWGSGLQLVNSATGGRIYGLYSAPDGKWYLSDETSRVHRLVIDQTGNVGIGTNTPAERLHVVGNRIRLQNLGKTLDLAMDGSAVDIYSSTSLSINNNTAGLSTWINPNAGNVGIGTTSPQAKLDVRGNVATNGVFGFSNVTQSTSPYGVYISAPTNQSMALVSNSVERVRITANGNVGIGTSAPAERLHVVGGRIRLENDGKTLDLRTDGSAVDIQSSSPLWINNITGQPTYINPRAGNVGIGTTSPQAKLDVAGWTRTDVLQIDAGADLAEPFAIAGEPEPGMVVAIDPDHAGQLRIADQPYDRMVAGVVSGAGGLRPGLTMQQPEIVQGEAHPVALTGRVYVWADASFGAIQPGDLLTTSATLGHAMKCSDYERAQGAVLGKAMSALEEGRGLVLVLVTLQ